jgi:hypothetical protein
VGCNTKWKPWGATRGHGDAATRRGVLVTAL